MARGAKEEHAMNTGMTKVSVHITGVTPCIMHNGQSANPLNDFAKAMKAITDKHDKTDEDQEALAKLQLESSFYIDGEGRPCWPGENIQGGIVSAAKKLNKGTVAKTAVTCDGLWPIIHDGPKHYKDLMNDPRFIDGRIVKVGRARVMRTRPIFRNWSLAFDIHVIEQRLDLNIVEEIMNIFGEQIGLSDFRPKYGRFLVDSFKV